MTLCPTFSASLSAVRTRAGWVGIWSQSLSEVHWVYVLLHGTTTQKTMFLQIFIIKDSHLIFGITCLILLVCRYPMRIWSRRPGFWFRRYTFGSVTWPCHTRHSPARHPVSCVPWIRAALICLTLLSTKTARPLKVSSINCVYGVFSSAVHLKGSLSPHR